MKFEKIGENMIKVTVTLSDLAERNIDLHSLTYNSAAAQELLWDMMEQAEDKYGFDFSNSHIVFEPLADISKGFIITITKLDEDMDFEYLHKLLKSSLGKNGSNFKKRARRFVIPSRIIYSFKSLEDTFDLAKALDAKFTGESCLYKLENTFYLILKSLKPFNYSRVELLLSEYGNKIKNSSFFEGYLNEYGNLMIKENALQVLRDYF